jgi:hypothetical protein
MCLDSHVINLPVFNPLAIELAVQYWHVRKINVHMPSLMMRCTPRGGNAAPLADATSFYDKLEIVFETALLARYLEDMRLAHIMTHKFYTLCMVPGKMDAFTNIVKTLYATEQDTRADIHVFRQLVALNVSLRGSLDVLINSEELGRLARNCPAFLKDVKMMDAACVLQQ